ncbi:MAG TPA: phosphate acyltransferase [Ignavibacteria bacterium]|nr:phosphate acyltransferase [Ignavibacteria bacterium]
MDLFKELAEKAKQKHKTIIFPESDDPRVIEAVKILTKKKLAKVILIDNGFSNIDLKDSDYLTVIDISFSAQFINEYLKIKQKKKKDYTYVQAEADLLNPMTFACMLLKNNFADGIIAGSVYSTSEVLKNAISIVGLEKGNKTVSSFFLFTFHSRHKLKEKVFVYADAGVIPVPTAEQLSDIAIQTSKNYKKLTGNRPRTAFLSFSTIGSAAHESLDRIHSGLKLTKKRDPKMIVEGELQFDAAFVPDVAKRKNPKGVIKGDANVFIFPDLNSGNIAYKITERIGDASATGPIVQGLSKPVMDLSRGCSSDDIVKMALVLSSL